jgi:hypothetical protein
MNSMNLTPPLSDTERGKNLPSFELKIKVSKPLSWQGRGLERGFFHLSNSR